jgi:tetratricopeptide (TPR) repeat protein
MESIKCRASHVAIFLAIQMWPAAFALAQAPLPSQRVGFDRTDVGANSLDDQINPLIPKIPRSEADEDRILASALLAEGRLLHQREDFKAALQRYQRAFRYSSASASLLREIVPLASRLGRWDEVARYALLATAESQIDPFTLRRLAVHLTENNEFSAALKAYEQLTPELKTQPYHASTILTWFEMGRLHLLTSDQRSAAECFDRIAEAVENPEKSKIDDAMIRELFREPAVIFGIVGEAFLASGQVDRAQAFFQRANDYDKNEGLLEANLARVSLTRKDRSAARSHLARYLELKSHSAGTLPYTLLKEIIRQEKADLDQWPPDELVRLREKDPDNVPLGHFLAKEFLESGKLEEAKVIYQQLLEKHTSLDALRGLIQIARARRDPAHVLESLGNAFRAAGTLDLVADQIIEIAQDDELARKAVGVFEKTDKAPGEQLFAAASIAARARMYEAADRLYAAALARSPERAEPIVMAWGFDMVEGNQHDRAARLFQMAIDRALVPERRAELHYYLSGVLFVQHQVEAALKQARESVRLEPDVASFALRPAWILYADGQTEKAEREYRAFLDQFADRFDSPATREAVHDARMALASTCAEANRNSEAVEWLEQVLDEDPGNVGALNDLGYLWADQNQHLLRALRMTQQATAAEPENKAYRDSLGWALFKLGRYAEAVQQLRQAAAGDDADPIILDHLGDALHKLGDREAAVAAWRNALQKLAQDASEKRKSIEDKIESSD